MKKTYYMYHVSFFGKEEDFFGKKSDILCSCFVKRRKPIASATDISDLTDQIQNEKALVCRPTILSITPLGKTRL